MVEVAYNEVQKSPTYRSGLALRFARIVRVRDDKARPRPPPWPNSVPATSSSFRPRGWSSLLQFGACERTVSTGIPKLDAMLGGGLLAGTLTVVYGATGIGKTHLGLTFAAYGRTADGARGVILDLNGRGDSSNTTSTRRGSSDGPYARGPTRSSPWLTPIRRRPR